MPVQNKESSDETPPIRSGRIFQRDGAWYFRTREGHDHGPYESKEDVVKDLVDYMDLKLFVVNEQNKNSS